MRLGSPGCEDGVFGGEAEDGVYCAGSRSNPTARGDHLPGIFMQLREAGGPLVALHRGLSTQHPKRNMGVQHPTVAPTSSVIGTQNAEVQ